MNPYAIDLGTASAVAGQRPSPPGGDRRQAAAPRRDRDLVVLHERHQHVDPHPTDEPEVLRRAPARLLDVVDRDVLREPCQRVQPHASAGVQVCEPDATSSGEGATSGRRRDELVHGESLPVQ
jgi:hypothetical protein